MPTRTSKTGSDLFIIDNSDTDWKVRKYLHDWADIATNFDIATGYFEIGALLALDGQWQKLDKLRILMGDEVSLRTKKTFEQGLTQIAPQTATRRPPRMTPPATCCQVAAVGVEPLP